MGNGFFGGRCAPPLVDLGQAVFAFSSLLTYNALDGSQALPGDV
jgi:hypothetical protein